MARRGLLLVSVATIACSSRGLVDGSSVDASTDALTTDASSDGPINRCDIVPCASCPATNIASSLKRPAAAAIDDRTMFWLAYASVDANWEDGSLWSMDLASRRQTSLATQLTFSWSVLIDDANVYYATGTPLIDAGIVGGIWSVPRAAGTPLRLVGGLVQPHVVALTGADVIFVNATVDGSTISSVPKTGGAPRVLASGDRFTGLVVVGRVAYYGESVSTVDPATGTRVPTNGNVWSVPIGGGAPTLLATSTSWEPTAGVTSDGAVLYFARSPIGPGNPTDIVRMSLAGGSTDVLASCAGSYPMSIVVDDESVYWNIFSTSKSSDPYGVVGAVARVSKSGGVPQMVATNQPQVFVARSVGTSPFVFWFDQGTPSLNFKDGAVLRLTPP